MNKNHTKQKILDAALQLISQKGYNGATTREIARVAGVTEITLFRHFGAKEKLFEELLKRFTFLPELRTLLPELTELSCENALIEVGIRFLETLKRRKDFVRIMVCEVNVYPEKVREVYYRFIDELIQTLAVFFTNLKSQQVFRDISSDMAARAFLGMFFSYFNTEEIVRGHEISQHDKEQAAQEFVSIFVHGTLKK
ncbi:MAG TPA: TetR/AcrR family transcriptional regulator [Thermodesulfovibrionia bacterium]|nr:TetR/AcrR family transcriptional regulator [Thermodesulfovibrionia bacterium]